MCTTVCHHLNWEGGSAGYTLELPYLMQMNAGESLSALDQVSQKKILFLAANIGNAGEWNQEFIFFISLENWARDWGISINYSSACLGQINCGRNRRRRGGAEKRRRLRRRRRRKRTRRRRRRKRRRRRRRLDLQKEQGECHIHEDDIYSTRWKLEKISRLGSPALADNSHLVKPTCIQPSHLRSCGRS